MQSRVEIKNKFLSYINKESHEFFSDEILDEEITKIVNQEKINFIGLFANYCLNQKFVVGLFTKIEKEQNTILNALSSIKFTETPLEKDFNNIKQSISKGLAFKQVSINMFTPSEEEIISEMNDLRNILSELLNKKPAMQVLFEIQQEENERQGIKTTMNYSKFQLGLYSKSGLVKSYNGNTIEECFDQEKKDDLFSKRN
ncbi:MAG: hypothetical protein HYX60_00425 [Legionella longbeachae]|nr:hypothetical protein [Legionella longbeachae]